MVNEERLMRALSAPVAPTRDPAFTLAVISAAEAERYRVQTMRNVLRGAALAAAAVSLAAPMASLSAGQAQALLTGIATAAGLVLMVGAARFMSARITAILRL